MVYSFTGKQYRMRQNNDIYITSEMALVCLLEWQIKWFLKVSLILVLYK